MSTFQLVMYFEEFFQLYLSKNMRIPLIFSLLLLISESVLSQPGFVISESRDASTAYLGTANFVVGRIGRDCLANSGRTETPQAFVSVWQQRNMKYLAAMQKYLDARLGDAEASGGVAKRNAVMGELMNVVRSGAEMTVKAWLDQPDKLQACKLALSKIDNGSYDVSQTTPMYGELEALVKWAQ